MWEPKPAFFVNANTRCNKKRIATRWASIRNLVEETGESFERALTTGFEHLRAVPAAGEVTFKREAVTILKG